jgi:hypothetical protein
MRAVEFERCVCANRGDALAPHRDRFDPGLGLQGRATRPGLSREPRPVSASDPYNSTLTRHVAPSQPPSASLAANIAAARIGPTVWELDGPRPTLKRSNKLVFIAYGLHRGRGLDLVQAVSSAALRATPASSRPSKPIDL